MPGEQRKRTYRLTDQAVDGLDRLATRHRITVTALLEALGRLHRDLDLPIEVVDLAHEIDRERRSRR